MQKKDSASLLDNLFIAAPCQVPWASMQGTNRVRDCSQCSRKVYNLSDMSRSEAEAFLAKQGTSQCATFYRRQDGTIMTEDCPVGLRKLRDRYRAMVRVAGTVIAFLASLPAALAHRNNTSSTLTAVHQARGAEFRPVAMVGDIQILPVVTKSPGAQSAQKYRPMHLGVPAIIHNVVEPPAVEEAAFTRGKNGLPEDEDVFGSGIIHLRAEKAVGPDSRAYHQYLRAVENEDNGKHLVAATYYKNALRTMTESALDNLSENQSAYDPRLKQAIEEHLHRLQSILGSPYAYNSSAASNENQSGVVSTQSKNQTLGCDEGPLPSPSTSVSSTTPSKEQLKTTDTDTSNTNDSEDGAPSDTSEQN